MITRNRFFIISLIIFILAVTIPVSALNSYDMRLVRVDTAPSGAPGSPIYAGYDLINKGNTSSMKDYVRFYLSPDKEITGTDYKIGEAEISFVKAGGSAVGSIMGTVPTDIPVGKYYSGAIIESDFSLLKDENPADNILSGDQVTINGSYQRPQSWINSKISDLILNNTNEERRLRNLNELKRDSELDLISRENSEDMAKTGLFDHINSKGEDPPARAERHGYNQTKTTRDGSLFYGIGENIVKIPIGNVQEFGTIDPDNPVQIAQVAVRSFMESPPHKMALLLPDYDVIGVGVAFDGKNYYATQNFF